MNDRELLELAAKAAGFEWRYEDDGQMSVFMYDRRWIFWNPLTDDGDAFRLAVILRLDLTFYNGFQEVHAESSRSDGLSHSVVNYKDDIPAAARRAIVEQAASL